MSTVQAVMGNLKSSDRRILTAINTGASILSLLGSSFIVLCYLLFKDLRRFSFKLVFFLVLYMALGMSDQTCHRCTNRYEGFKSVGYYPLILIGSWAFATINRIHDFIEPGHRIFWLSVLDVGMAALMGLFDSIAYGLNSSVRRGTPWPLSVLTPILSR